MKQLVLGGVAAVLLAGVASAADVRSGALTLHDPIVRASLGQNPNTAAYVTISNAGDRPDRLVSISCACAAKVEAHASVMNGATMSMKPAGAVLAPAKGSVAFAPGGLHLMVTGLKAPLQDGATQEMTLRFERGGAVKVPFKVLARIPSGPRH